MNSSEPELSQDVVFDILSSPRRRYVLYYLRQADEPVKLTDLAEQLAAWENDTDPDSITDQERKRVYVSLYQTHIPRLDEAGIVEYDKDSGDVALAEGAKDIDGYLVSAEERISWQQFYLLLAAVGTLLLGLTTFDVAFFSAVSESVMTAFIILMFAVTAVSHTVVRILNRRSVPLELQR